MTSTKRKLDELDNDDALKHVKSSKVSSSSSYYESLFENQKNSDITIVALGREWKLHKIIISQSPYFGTMFSGTWKESEQNVITMEIPDENITQDALDAVFGSLYHGNVQLDCQNLIPVLATASMFQLDSICALCEEFMKETTNENTVLSYFKIADLYNLKIAKLAAKQWLEVNLLEYETDSKFLKAVSPEIMANVLSSPDLVVCYREESIYCLLRNWLYVNLQVVNVVEDAECINDEDVQIFFKEQNWKTPFLLTEQGKRFKDSFQTLRLKYLLLYPGLILNIENERIIPQNWFHDAYKDLWESTLYMNTTNPAIQSQQISEDEFKKECYRLAFYMEMVDEFREEWCLSTKDDEFFLGLDCIFKIRKGKLCIKRATQDGFLKTTRENYKIMIEVSVIWLNKQKQVIDVQNSDLLTVSLSDEKVSLMTFKRELTVPVYITINLMFMHRIARS